MKANEKLHLQHRDDKIPSHKASNLHCLSFWQEGFSLMSVLQLWLAVHQKKLQ